MKAITFCIIIAFLISISCQSNEPENTNDIPGLSNTSSNKVELDDDLPEFIKNVLREKHNNKSEPSISRVTEEENAENNNAEIESDIQTDNNEASGLNETAGSDPETDKKKMKNDNNNEPEAENPEHGTEEDEEYNENQQETEKKPDPE